MATRPIFIPTPNSEELFKEESIDFQYYNGFAVSQKQKCIKSLHVNAANKGYRNILEVSTKSEILLGQKLSAFSLQIETEDLGLISLESAFQGSKVFVDGGPYTDIYEKDSLSAKRDERLKSSGDLQAFEFEGTIWGLEPKSAFYDWIYTKALCLHVEYIKYNLIKYDAFTDIEFNPKKSINCQARTCAIIVSLIKMDLLNKAMRSPEDFIEVVYKKELVQSSFEF